MTRRLTAEEMEHYSLLVFTIGASLLVLALVATIAGIWWWAVAGMSEDIATAYKLTVAIVGLIGLAAAVAGILGGDEA